MIVSIRQRSLIRALWINVLIFAIGTLFIYGFPYIEYNFALLFIFLMIFTVKFNVEIYKTKRNEK